MDSIYVIGYPKSGSTWLARLLGDALDSHVGAVNPERDSACIAHEGDERKGRYSIRQGHELPDAVSGLVVFMVRDPRDIIVSAAHHWGISIKTVLDGMDLGMWPLDIDGSYHHFMRRWMAVLYPIVLTRYEDLLADTPRELTRILASLDLKASGERIRAACERQSFAARRAYAEAYGDRLSYGREYQLRFLRRGVAGAWRDELPREYWRRVWGICGRILVMLGYEDGPGWLSA